jgi:hypothetical protein
VPVAPRPTPDVKQDAAIPTVPGKTPPVLPHKGIVPRKNHTGKPGNPKPPEPPAPDTTKK